MMLCMVGKLLDKKLLKLGIILLNLHRLNSYIYKEIYSEGWIKQDIYKYVM